MMVQRKRWLLLFAFFDAVLSKAAAKVFAVPVMAWSIYRLAASLFPQGWSDWIDNRMRVEFSSKNIIC